LRRRSNAHFSCVSYGSAAAVMRTPLSLLPGFPPGSRSFPAVPASFPQPPPPSLPYSLRYSFLSLIMVSSNISAYMEHTMTKVPLFFGSLFLVRPKRILSVRLMPCLPHLPSRRPDSHTKGTLFASVPAWPPSALSVHGPRMPKHRRGSHFSPLHLFLFGPPLVPYEHASSSSLDPPRKKKDPAPRLEDLSYQPFHLIEATSSPFLLSDANAKSSAGSLRAFVRTGCSLARGFAPRSIPSLWVPFHKAGDLFENFR